MGAKWVRIEDTRPPRDACIWVYPWYGKVEMVSGDWWVFNQPVTHWMLMERPIAPSGEETV